jgi:hypothetical protein
MRSKKPFKILEEHIKYHHIVIDIFKRRNVFSFGLSTSIGYGGIGFPEDGVYPSFYEAKNAALHSVVKYHKEPLQKTLLRKFRLMLDLDQPLLFYD